MSNTIKKHRLLVAAEVVFFPIGKNTEISSLRLNTVITNPSTAITVTTLAKAQQSCQMQFFRQFDQEALPTVEIADVVLLHVGYLGETSDDEFYDRKEESAHG